MHHKNWEFIIEIWNSKKKNHIIVLLLNTLFFKDITNKFVQRNLK